MPWLKYSRGIIHPHRFYIPLVAHFELSQKLSQLPLVGVLFTISGNKIWWGWEEKNTKKWGFASLTKCQTKERAKKHFTELQKLAQQSNACAQKILTLDLSQYSNKKLIELYNLTYQKMAPFHALWNTEIDAIDVVFEKIFESILKKELKKKLNHEEIADLYKKLARPIHKTYVSQEEIDIIKISLKPKASQEDFKKLEDKYWWTSLGWENVIPRDASYFKKKVQEYRKKKNSKKRLEQLMNQDKLAENVRKELIKKYNLSREMEHWLIIADQFTYLHDLRKETQCRSIYATELLLVEVARRFQLNIHDLEWLWHPEIIDILNGKPFNKNLVQARKKATFVKITEKRIIWLEGDKALSEKEKYFPEKVDKVQEIVGVVANKGQAKARVKVCSGYKEALKKIKKGDILVCGMTTPDYVPAMRKAAAIITDEGGITCHAAIISRELHIPCIVSTKIATQVLKDGYLVEVDAIKGIVKIIK